MTRLPPEDFDEFIRMRSPALLRSAWLLTGDAGRAEDLLQTALARVWPRWARVVAGTSPDTYVRKVLYTTYLSWYRRRWRFEVPTGASGEPADRSDVAGEAAQRDAVRRALAALSRQQRAVVVLRYVEDLPVAATAELLGCSETAVKVQAHRALAILRGNPHLAAFGQTEVSL
jgi:RNA polymerase sigma-70 factor (sigma-E family)